MFYLHVFLMFSLLLCGPMKQFMWIFCDIVIINCAFNINYDVVKFCAVISIRRRALLS